VATKVRKTKKLNEIRIINKSRFWSNVCEANFLHQIAMRNTRMIKKSLRQYVAECARDIFHQRQSFSGGQAAKLAAQLKTLALFSMPARK